MQEPNRRKIRWANRHFFFPEHSVHFDHLGNPHLKDKSRVSVRPNPGRPFCPTPPRSAPGLGSPPIRVVPTLADAVAARGAAQMESRLAAAVLFPLHLRAAGCAAEGGVTGHAAVRGRCGKKTGSAFDPWHLPHSPGPERPYILGRTLQQGRNVK